MGFFSRKKKKKEIENAKLEKQKIEDVETKNVVEKAPTSKKVTTKASAKQTVTKKSETAKKENPTKKESKKEPKKESAPKQETEKATKKPIYRVMYEKENRVWLIKKDGAKRTIASFATKEEALERVRDLSSTNDMNFIVHKKDGKFQKKTNIKK